MKTANQPMPDLGACVGSLLLFYLSVASSVSGAETAPAARGVDQATASGTFRALYTALEDNYPMLEFAGWKHEQWRLEFESRVANAPSTQAAFEAMDELVCRLNDYHTRLSWPDKPPVASPPVRLEPALLHRADGVGIWGEARPPIEMPLLTNIGIAVIAAATNLDLRVGDEVVSVDGVPIAKALEIAWRRSVGCTVAGKVRSAASRILAGDPAVPVRVGVRRMNRDRASTIEDIALPRAGGLQEETVSMRDNGDVPLIRISRWSNSGGDLVEKVDGILNRIRDRPFLVIDVRGNGGGQDRLADEVVGRFLSEPVISSISFHRQVPGTTFERKILRSLPRGPWRYSGRVAVLTDEGCMSACEHFVSGMVEAGALACGTATSGACGLVRTVNLPGGARLNVSQTFPVHSGGIPSPQLGIAPHLWAPRTFEQLRAGEDAAVTAALRWLKSGDSLPPRAQPVAPFRRRSP